MGERSREMTNEHKKLLTEEVLGECWHVIEESGDVYLCSKCGKSRATIFMEGGRCTDNRTFDNDADMMALRKALRYKMLWHKFFMFSFAQSGFCIEKCGSIQQMIHELEIVHTRQMAYLDENPERFCCLVAQWLEEKNEKL